MPTHPVKTPKRMHWLRYYRQPSPHAPRKRGRGADMTISPQAAATPHPGAPLPVSPGQRDARNKAMRTLYAEGVPLVEIARRYDLHPSTVGRLVRVPRI